jgi:hypothetical protein
MTDPVSHSSFEELVFQRRAKLTSFRAAGVNPFPARYDGMDRAAEVLSRYASLPPGGHAEETVAVAGRVMTRRDMGKTIFAHLQDLSGKVQIYLKKDELGEAFASFQNGVDLGDIVGASGFAFRTRTGEITLHVKSWTLLSKALRPPPEKFHGMTDVEVRYRRREVDLFSNEEVRARFLARQRIVSSLRQTLAEKNFIEVETPVLQSVPGGAAAKPFATHHNALDLTLSLRIAPELFLKRLLVGGLERVFEIGRAFRNEGIDTRHNPEFTILEAYQAYTDVVGMMDLAEELIGRRGLSALWAERRPRSLRRGRRGLSARAPPSFLLTARSLLICRLRSPAFLWPTFLMTRWAWTTGPSAGKTAGETPRPNSGLMWTACRTPNVSTRSSTKKFSPVYPRRLFCMGTRRRSPRWPRPPPQRPRSPTVSSCSCAGRKWRMPIPSRTIRTSNENISKRKPANGKPATTKPCRRTKNF